MKFTTLYNIILESDNVLESIKHKLLEEHDHNSWTEFVNSQSVSECQFIAHFVEQINPNFKRVFGEIEVDNPYLDEYQEEQKYMTHHWNVFNDEIFDFSKGTLQQYVNWNNIHSVDTSGDEWRYNKVK